VRIWVRTDAIRRVALRLSETETGPSLPVAWAYPEARRDFTAVLEAGGLAAARRYWYQLEIDGAPALAAPLPVTTSPPPGAAGAWSFAFGSCTKHDAQPIFGRVAADAFLFIGDNHYGNTSDLGALRWHYRWALARPVRAALAARTPTLAVWDDHDYTGNNTDGTAAGKAVARRAFTEFWAHRSYGNAAGEGIHHRWDRGDVSFFLLDDRTWRKLDGMLGAEQTAWLLDELAASDAVFKIVANGSQWTREGSDDSWAAFPLARDALFAGLRERRVEGVVLLSGDVHRAELRLILLRADGGYDLPELTSSPLANDPSPCEADSELRACFDDDSFFIRVEVDTTLPDPLLAASIVDAGGRERTRWEIRRSALEY
jgi:alkaline phosphatase D